MENNFSKLENIMQRYGKTIVNKDFPDALSTVAKVYNIATKDTQKEITELMMSKSYKEGNMSEINKAYVISKYYDNGEPWEDNYSDEKPVKVFSNLFSATTYCKNRGEKIEDATLYNSEVAKYSVTKEKHYIACPIGKDWLECDEDFDEDYCYDCQNDNRDTFYDYSFEQLKIYEVETGD